MAKLSLYDQLVSLTDHSLGLNSKLLVNDLIKCQLHINPRNINVSQLKKIDSWLATLISLLSSSQKAADTYLEKLRLLEEDH